MSGYPPSIYHFFQSMIPMPRKPTARETPALKHQLEDLLMAAFLCGIDLLVALEDHVVAENRGQPLLGNNDVQVVVTRGADGDGEVAVDVDVVAQLALAGFMKTR